jgi:hypothetical protein
VNYSWKASPNRWGRPEFNATFSIGFGNGLHSLRSFQMANTTRMAIKWFQCEYTLLHRRAWQSRGAELGRGGERNEVLES